MNDKKLKKWIDTALMTALCGLLTALLRFPSPIGGTVHAGDAAVLLSAFLLGPGYGALAAALGSALADLLTGYAMYAPATALLKALMALLCGFARRKSASLRAFLFAAIAAECLMAAGYFLWSALVLGLGWAAAAELPANLLQGAFGVGCALALAPALKKSL